MTELERLAATASGGATDDISGGEVVAALHPVMIFRGTTEAEALTTAASWSRDHLARSSAVIASWFAFRDDVPEPFYEMGLVLEM